jgi:hypothetical protein
VEVLKGVEGAEGVVSFKEGRPDVESEVRRVVEKARGETLIVGAFAFLPYFSPSAALQSPAKVIQNPILTTLSGLDEQLAVPLPSSIPFVDPLQASKRRTLSRSTSPATNTRLHYSPLSPCIHRCVAIVVNRRFPFRWRLVRPCL